MLKAVFFDKDGVLNVDNGISGTNEAVVLFPGLPEVIKSLRERGFNIFVVTNQPIVARGIIKEDTLEKILDEFKERVESNDDNIKIDKIYYCPHHPHANLEEYRINCDCRKPKPGMILEAVREFNIDVKKSYMIGDRISDIIAGSLAGCKTIQILSGKHIEKMIESDIKNTEKITPDYVVKDLKEILDIIK
ncbi:D-glycero-alpha-D-manno-heptose-1,7-bisphosphate 7-phosphatase [Elusimicrobiota bacterium]